jgi:hypothetical protein
LPDQVEISNLICLKAMIVQGILSYKVENVDVQIREQIEISNFLGCDILLL